MVVGSSVVLEFLGFLASSSIFSIGFSTSGFLSRFLGPAAGVSGAAAGVSGPTTGFSGFSTSGFLSRLGTDCVTDCFGGCGSGRLLFNSFWSFSRIELGELGLAEIKKSHWL